MPEMLERRELLAVDVTFGDIYVERAVRGALMSEPIATAIKVTDVDMLQLKTLYLDSNLITNLTGLPYATNLQTLVLRPGNVAQAGQLGAAGAGALLPLQGRTSLQTLVLAGTNINPAAFSVLSSLTSLTTLDLSRNGLTSLSSLPSNLNSVRNLDLSYNKLNLADPADLPGDRLETVASLKLYGNNDPVATTDQSFNPYHLRGLLIDYDLPPVGVEKANSLPTLAAALHYSPVEIYEYIYNNIQYQAYDGMMKGAFATFNTHAGNAWDQSALLLELLKESYSGTVYGTAALAPAIIGVRATAPEASVAKLVGTVDGVAAEFLLDAPGIGGDPALNADRSGGNITFDHAFVQVTLPAPGGTTQFRLDPSWKLKEYYSSVATPLLASLPFNRTEYISTLRTDLAVEWYEKEALEYLAQYAPGKSLAEVGYDGVIKPRRKRPCSAGTRISMQSIAPLHSSETLEVCGSKEAKLASSRRENRIAFRFPLAENEVLLGTS